MLPDGGAPCAGLLVVLRSIIESPFAQAEIGGPTRIYRHCAGPATSISPDVSQPVLWSVPTIGTPTRGCCLLAEYTLVLGGDLELDNSENPTYD